LLYGDAKTSLQKNLSSTTKRERDPGGLIKGERATTQKRGKRPFAFKMTGTRKTRLSNTQKKSGAETAPGEREEGGGV